MASADAAERILLSVRADVLRQIVQTEAQLEKKYAKKIDELQKKLRSGKSVSAKVRKAMAEISNEVEPDIERLIQSGAIKGKQAARKSFKKLFGSRARSRFPTDQESLVEAGKRIRGTTTVDKIPLSKRLWRAHSKAGTDMAKQVQASMRAGNSMQQTAEEILRRRHPRITPPQYAEKLAQAARRGGDVLTKVSAKYEAQLNRLGSAAGPDFTMRPIARELVRDLKKAKPDQVDAVVKRFMKEKAQRHATMIARSESIEAYKQSYRKSTEDQDWTKGYRWSLGANHPKPDECDILAGQNLYGLGPGGYPADAVPDTPHPNDMCVQVAIIDTDHFKREKAKRNNEPEPPEPWKQGKKQTSEQWLKKQSQSKQKQILGPTKYDRFQKAPNQVLGKDGIPKRVKDLPRARTVTKAASVTKARMVQPREVYDSVIYEGKVPAGELNTHYDAVKSRPLKRSHTPTQAAKAIRGLREEHAAVYASDGKTLLLRKAGKSDYVQFTAVERKFMEGRNVSLIHNHPRPPKILKSTKAFPMMLSDMDLTLAMDNQMKGIAAVCDGDVGFYMRRTAAASKWTPKLAKRAENAFREKVDQLMLRAERNANKWKNSRGLAIPSQGEVYERIYSELNETWFEAANKFGKDYGFKIHKLTAAQAAKKGW